MQKYQYPWQDPLVNFLIELDKKCEESEEPYSDKNFHLCFDKLSSEYQIDLILASQLKNKILDEVKNKKVTAMKDLLLIIKKTFYLYVQNIDEAALKFAFLSTLSEWIKSQEKINQAVLEREVIKTSEKNLGLFEGKIIFQSKELNKKQTDKEPLDITIDDRVRHALVDYLHCNAEDIKLTFENIVIQSVLFAAEADASRGLVKIMESMTDHSLLSRGNYTDDNTYNNSNHYTNYISRNHSLTYVTTDICAEAFQEVCNHNVSMEFDKENLTFNQDFIKNLEKLKNQYAPYKDASFNVIIDIAYVFQAENRRLKNSLDEFTFTHNKLKMAKQNNIVETGRKIQSYLHELKNTPGTGVNTCGLTKDLIAINRAIAASNEKKNINYLNQRAMIHKNSADNRKALGIMMLTLGVGLMILAGVVIAGTIGIGTAGGAALMVAGITITEAGIGFFDRGYRRGKMATREATIVHYLSPTPRRPHH